MNFSNSGRGGLQALDRVSERTEHPSLGQRRSNPPNEHMLGRRSGNDESADANIITGLNLHPG